MRKTLAIILCLCMMCATLTACTTGVSQEEYDKVVGERDRLVIENKVLQLGNNQGTEPQANPQTDLPEDKKDKVSKAVSDIKDKLDSSSDAVPSEPVKKVEPTPSKETPSSKIVVPPPPPQNNTPTQTTGQKNALAKAKSYLDFMSFSYQGLIQQLEYEKFSLEDSTYGAKNCGADWNAQAAKKAKSYLEIMSFSRDGLIEQLEYDGFTYEQAAYGVSANGY